MDESRKAFDAWLANGHDSPFWRSTYKTWRAAAEWARKDERERLAKLAEDRLEVSKAKRDAGVIQIVSHIMVAGMSAEEIRAGELLNEP